MIVYPGGWVRTSALSECLPCKPRCGACQRGLCGPFWRRLGDAAVRCYKCGTGDAVVHG